MPVFHSDTVFVIASDNINMARQIFPLELHQFALLCRRTTQRSRTAILSLCCKHSVMSVGTYGWWTLFLRERRRLMGAGWTGARLHDPENWLELRYAYIFHYFYHISKRYLTYIFNNFIISR